MRDERIDKLKKLRELGLKPFPSQSNKVLPNKEVIDDFDKHQGSETQLAGRITSLRHHGQLAFVDIEDATGTIQLYLRKDELEPLNISNQTLGFDEVGLLDVGDFIEAFGVVTKTKTGEISLMPKRLRLITKSIRPLPNQHDLPSDPEYLFRRRYVDLSTSPERREMFRRKSAFWRANRRFLEDKGFIEIETPVLEHVTGGADARPFTTYMNALDQDFFLRISTELYQKRLIGGGFEKVFTFGPNFRNEGLSEEHLTEFYQIEWYWAYADYRDNMQLTKELFRHVANEVYGKTKFSTRGHDFDLADEWDEISYPDIIKERFDVDIFETQDSVIKEILDKEGVKLEGAINRNRLIDNLWKLIRKTISGPAFLINEPAFMSPLSKSRADKPELTERYHVIIAGSELANGYSELNDPFEQLDRFREQQSQRDAGDDEAQMMDIDYVEMLEYGMPPTSGHGHSERVFWFLEDITAREGTLFPALKHRVEPLTREIYDLTTLPSSKASIATTMVTGKKQEASNNVNLPSREQSEGLLEEWIENENLRGHCRMVARAMEAYAQKLGEDKELWYQTGLLHDLDWEKYPDEHPNKAISEVLKDYPESMLQAIAAHAPERTGTSPQSTLDKYLYACDELSGFLNAYALMRPNGFEGMKSKSVMKKIKDKSFAANVNREDIQKGFELIGGEPKEHVEFLINVFEKSGAK